MTTNSDEQLIADYLKGDAKSLEVLVRRYLNPIFSFVFRYTGSIQDAEDITQEVFVKIWRNLKRFKREKSFKTWIFSIAKNTSIDFLRKSRSAFGGKKMVSFSDTLTEKFADPNPLPDKLFDHRNIVQKLTSVINKLLPKYRMVLLLRYNEHFNFREIAEVLREPLNTVKSRHRRALVLLKKLLAKS